jgi:hypothetical protein
MIDSKKNLEADADLNQSHDHELNLHSLFNSLQRIEKQLNDLISQQLVREWYSTDEVAKILGKAEYTVREWCRMGRILAEKRQSGRGKFKAWVVSHQELTRFQREGLLHFPGI